MKYEHKAKKLPTITNDKLPAIKPNPLSRKQQRRVVTDETLSQEAKKTYLPLIGNISKQVKKNPLSKEERKPTIKLPTIHGKKINLITKKTQPLNKMSLKAFNNLIEGYSKKMNKYDKKEKAIRNKLNFVQDDDLKNTPPDEIDRNKEQLFKFGINHEYINDISLISENDNERDVYDNSEDENFNYSSKEMSGDIDAMYSDYLKALQRLDSLGNSLKNIQATNLTNGMKSV